MERPGSRSRCRSGLWGCCEPRPQGGGIWGAGAGHHSRPTGERLRPAEESKESAGGPWERVRDRGTTAAGGDGGGEQSLFGKLIYRRPLSEWLPPPGGRCGRRLEGGEQVTKCL